MIVDFGELEKAILKFEELLKDYNFVEKNLIVQQVAARMKIAEQKARQSEITDGVMNNINMKNLFNKLRGGGE